MARIRRSGDHALGWAAPSAAGARAGGALAALPIVDGRRQHDGFVDAAAGPRKVRSGRGGGRVVGSEPDHTVGELVAAGVVGGGENGGALLASERGERGPDRLGAVGIEMGGGLVGQDEASVAGADGHERTGDLHAAQLAAGELIGAATGQAGEPDVGERRGHGVVRCASRRAHLVGHRRGERREALADHRELVGPHLRVELLHVDAADADRPASFEESTAAGVDQRRLADATRPGDRHEFAAPDVDVEPVEHGPVATS